MENTQIAGSDPGYMVVPELAEAGCISYWRLSGGVNLGELREAWLRAGLDEKLLPAAPSRETALRRSVSDLGAKRRLIRPLARRGAWAVVNEAVDRHTETLSWDVSCEVRLTPSAVKDGLPTVSIAPSYHELGDQIRSGYTKHLGELAQEDISGWLVKLACGEKAVALRDTGGVYFIPRPSVPFWRRAVEIIRAVSQHKVFQLPALKNSEAIDAIVDAVTEEGRREAEAIEADLAQEGDAALGARALVTRGTHCEEVISKIASYESLLGVKMDAVRARIERLRANLAAAALIASSDAGEEAAA